jgi:hypothetical protein
MGLGLGNGIGLVVGIGIGLGGGPPWRGRPGGINQAGPLKLARLGGTT